MAEDKSTAANAPARTSQQQPSTDRTQMQRRDTKSNVALESPWDYFDRMAEEMDRTFDRMLGGWGLAAPRRSRMSRSASWAPRVEAFQKGDRFIVRAELPGLKKDDLTVEIAGEAITIQGERQEEQHEEREGYFHSERQYGQFYRTIPLPEGVIGESAEAKFNDGVLEIAMQAPPAEAKNRRKIDIR